MLWVFYLCYVYATRKKDEVSLTHWGRVTHICISELTIIGSDDSLPPGRCQAIIWTNAGILLIGPLGTNFNEIIIKIHIISFKKMHLDMAAILSRPQCVKYLPQLQQGPFYFIWQTTHDVKWMQIWHVTWMYLDLFQAMAWWLFCSVLKLYLKNMIDHIN